MQGDRFSFYTYGNNKINIIYDLIDIEFDFDAKNKIMVELQSYIKNNENNINFGNSYFYQALITGLYRL